MWFWICGHWIIISWLLPTIIFVFQPYRWKIETSAFFYFQSIEHFFAGFDFCCQINTICHPHRCASLSVLSHSPVPGGCPPQAITASAELSSLLDAWGTPIRECWRDQVFFAPATYESWFMHDPHIKMTLCQILSGRRLDKYHPFKRLIVLLKTSPNIYIYIYIYIYLMAYKMHFFFFFENHPASYKIKCQL